MAYYEKWTLIPSPEMGISHLPVLLINHVLVSSPSLGLREVIPFSPPPFFLCVCGKHEIRKLGLEDNWTVHFL